LKIENRNYYQISIQGRQEIILPKQYVISGDASSASYWFLWAQLSREPVEINITHACGQGDIRLVDILMEMGASYKEQEGTLKYYPADLQQFIGDVSDVPDIVPTLAVICAGLDGVSRLQNVSHLRHKECDRLEALVENLNRLSIVAKVEKINGREDLIVTGGVITPKDVIRTYDDHRIAMAYGTLQTLFPSLTVDNPACVEKSYPTFWDQLTALNT
jgi:3-phosphoshikimate 1-carboxyvinyltransferase